MKSFKVLIAVLTTGDRVQTFSECITSLINLASPSNATYEVLVVENSQHLNANVRTILSENSEQDIQLNHIQVKEQGIPFARNGAINYGTQHGYSHLAFIDDDALADEGWIKELTKSIESFDIISGPQIPLFNESASDIYKMVNIYKERNIIDGESLKWAATNNVLFSLDFLNKHSLCFNNALIFGGEDKELSFRACSLGARMQWRSNAIVREYISDNRMNLHWIYNRSFRIGAIGFIIESSRFSKFTSVFVCLLKASCYLSRGIVTLIPYSLLSNKTAFNSLADIGHGLGFLKGLINREPVNKYY